MKLTSQAGGTTGDRSAGVPPATVSPSSKQASGTSRRHRGEVTIRDRGRLPHWEKDGATYFITFRLADSLPKSVLERIESELRPYLDATPTGSWLRGLYKYPQAEFPYEQRNPVIAEDVASTLRHFDHSRYRLFAWCIMPNHVHVVVGLFPGETLATVVHSWKSFSAKQANRILGRHGAFWQREYYDHLIRGEEEFERAVRYVAENPAKADLKHWKWVWVGGRGARAACPELVEGKAAEDGGATKTA